MAISRFFTTECIVDTPSPDEVDSTIDAEGVPAVAADEWTTVCHVQPYSPGRNADDDPILGREEARRARRAWFPADTPITFASTVTIEGLRYSVAGDPATWRVGSSNDHIEVLLVRQVTPGVLGSSS